MATYVETASGGILASGESVNNLYLFAVGGAVSSGLSQITFMTIAQGGILAAGEAEAVSIIIGLGGSVLNGTATVQAIFTDNEDKTGAEPGGTASYEWFVPDGRGAALGGFADCTTNGILSATFHLGDTANDGYWTTGTGTFAYLEPYVLAGHENTLGNIHSFFRFDNIPIPNSTNVVSAQITIRSTGFSTGTPFVRLFMNASDDALAPTSQVEASLKLLTAARSNLWYLESYTDGTQLTSPDFSNALQEIVNRPGWVSNNAVMVLMMTATTSGNNYHTFADDSNENWGAARLHVSYYGGTGYVEAFLGGISTGGTSIAEIHTPVGFGTLLAGGTSEVSPATRFFGSGGASSGGVAEVTSFVSDEPVGDLLSGGEGLYYVTSDFTTSGGLLLAGDSIISDFIFGQGGSLVGGSAPEEFYDIVEEVDDHQGISAAGNGMLEFHTQYSSSGSVTVAGSSTFKNQYVFISTGNSADTPPDYAGVSVGYRNSENPTIVNLQFTIHESFLWSIDKSIEVRSSIKWNTGNLPLYYYRIVGKPKYIDECDPIQGAGECCKQFIMNVPARSISDLCEKLRNRRWKWPISLVQRFSRPAENANVTELDENCNVLEEVQICDNIICAEYCLDYDVRETWGISTKSQVDSFFVASTSGSVVVTGIATYALATNGFNYQFTSSGRVRTGGTAKSLSNYAAGFGGVTIGGAVAALSSSWSYVGGDWPFSKTRTPVETDQFIELVDDRTWSNTDNIKVSDDSYAIANTSLGGKTKYLVAKGFYFYVPDNADIIGIEAEIERHSTGSVRDESVYLVVDEEIVSDNMAVSTTWPIGIDATKTYGALTNVWRDADDPDYLGDWDLADVNNKDFGLAIRVEPVVSQPVSETKIDSLNLRVYWEFPNQHLSFSGEAVCITNNYNYVGDSGLLLVGGTVSVPRMGLIYAPTGRGSMGPDFAGITLQGTYLTAVTYSASGSVTLTGSAEVSPGGLSLNGTAYIETTQNYWTGSGETVLAGLSRIRANKIFASSGSISLSGLAGYNNKFMVVSEGGVTFAGDANWSSNGYKVASNGSLTLSGVSETNFSDFGTIETVVGAVVSVLDVALQFYEETTNTAPALTTTLTECSCADMDLLMPMTHNLDTGNKFAQFLSRNDLSFDRVLTMKWSNVNNSWIYNQAFNGLGSSGSNQEFWNLIFQLQCTNLIGGEVLENKVWKYSLQIIQKDLVTLADFDTRLVVSFVTEDVCDDGFSVLLNIDTQNDYAYLTPDTTIYDYKLYDNIGLFKSQYWLANPELKIELSQIGIDSLIERYPLYVV